MVLETSTVDVLPWGEDNMYRIHMGQGTYPGEIFIECRPVSRKAVQYYEIQVDDNRVHTVAKESIVRISLDAGKHRLVIGAKNFGWKSRATVQVTAGKTTSLTYKGPYWSWLRGSLR